MRALRNRCTLDLDGRDSPQHGCHLADLSVAKLFKLPPHGMPSGGILRCQLGCTAMASASGPGYTVTDWDLFESFFWQTPIEEPVDVSSGCLSCGLRGFTCSICVRWEQFFLEQGRFEAKHKVTA